jgi:hypothetical protein
MRDNSKYLFTADTVVIDYIREFQKGNNNVIPNAITISKELGVSKSRIHSILNRLSRKKIIEISEHSFGCINEDSIGKYKVIKPDKRVILGKK